MITKIFMELRKPWSVEYVIFGISKKNNDS